MTDIRTILRRTASELSECGSPSPRLDAEVLLRHYLKIDQVRLLMHPERRLSKEETAGFERWVDRRRRGEPVAYIVGEKEFWSLRFEVDREVLIPRPETECLVEEVLESYSPAAGDLRIIDVGTGSGAIGVTLARELPMARVVGTDVSQAALEVAFRNALANGVAERMEFVRGDLFAAVPGPFDLVVSNPPYVPDGAYPLLPPGVRDFEPRGALIAGPDGAAFHREIIREGVSRLKTGGRIFLEIGAGQKDLVGTLFQEAGAYEEIRFREDYGGMDRVASARKTGK